MGKRNRKWSFQTYLRYRKNGRGLGDLGDYKPWITTHDFPSKGKVVRIIGKKTNRIHHLMSQLEKIYFLQLDNTPTVEDIKEQFPLPLDMTQLIAARLGIRHPCINGFSYVMTTDFLYKQDGIWHAVQIKHSEELEKERIKEKFSIEKEYYRMIDIDWKVLTEKELPAVVAENYYWLNSGEDIEHLIPNHKKRKHMISAFLELYNDYTVPFHVILSEMDNLCHVKAGTSMQLFKHCIRNNKININLLKAIDLEEPRLVEDIPGGFVYV